MKASRTRIKATMRAARAEAMRRGICDSDARQWEAACGSHLQKSALRPADDNGNSWAGDMCTWQDVLDSILPGESVDVWCYSRGFGGDEVELRCNVGIWLSEDGLHAEVSDGINSPRVRVV